MSGGTDVCSSFVGRSADAAVYEGELQARALGAGRSRRRRAGKLRRRPRRRVGGHGAAASMPALPVGRRRRLPVTARATSTCFRRLAHGDWIEITERGTAIINGRSDSTINATDPDGHQRDLPAPSGVDDVVDALAVIFREGEREAGWRFSSSCATAVSRRTSSSPRSSMRVRTDVAAARPNEIRQSPRSRAPCPARSSKSR